MTQGHERRMVRRVLWLLAATLAVFSVLIVNGRPLFYFDTMGYYEQGMAALRSLGLLPAPEALASAGGSGATPHTVDGSRSPFYSLLAGLFAAAGAFDLLILFNVGVLVATLWLVAQIVRRLHAPALDPVVLTALAIIAGSLGSLPFYVAYLMPDLMAPVLLIAVAAITAFGREMRPGELLAAFLLASVAIVSHLSHYGIAAAMVPAVALVAVLAGRRRWWLPPLILLAIVAVGYAQQQAFRMVAAKTVKSDVVIQPYITARLIQDGPGYDWLEAHCPDSAIATCKLWDALHISDDPYRLTASHILFETSKRLGSYRLMTPEDQKAVADAQIGFFSDVLKEMPLAVAGALIANTLKQSAMVSVDMTIPTDQIVRRNRVVTETLSGPLLRGRLAEDRRWIDTSVRLHRTYYAAALVLSVILLLGPGLPKGLRVFGVMVLLGVLANAFVCGGISQPANRYGARVIWLVPMLAAMLLYWSARPPTAREKL
ncbi:hypothetical protein OU426_07465 [Frigidibacter sp. RF13]|uniref:hypothetical protein n=1 Tax=Frigidibacter sp. RF13 TaxID=2997340 RepID=UPI00226F6653|nr:hypothetical protein [Frigidibacter sp. RF13]MCY1126685.1 hypothetical protein [Frigidibacter sp. RF13]